MAVRLHYFPQNFKNFEFESKSRNSHHDLSDFIFFLKFSKILNLNPKVGTAIMTCPTSYFSLNFQKNLNLIIKSGTAIMTCPTSYFFPKYFKILNLNHKVG